MTLILRGGRVIDPVSGLDTIADVTVDGTTIKAIAPSGDSHAQAATPGATEVDCRGALVVPGLIDLHVHVMPGLGDFCVEADAVGVDQGVPTIVDGGTSGVATFELARRAVIDHPATGTRVLAFLDPNQLYLATKDFICHRLEIAADIRNLDVDSLAACIERNRDVIVGLKVRACRVDYSGVSPFLEGAKAAAGALPIMVHHGRFPHTPSIPTNDLLRALRTGDIITHAFRGGGGFLDGRGGVTHEFADAVARGVRLDVGHSGTDFRFREARRLFDAGYFPTTISTDLNVFTIDGPVFSLVETMSKIYALGVPLNAVIAMTTANTAAVLGRSESLGRLAVGHSADVSVLRLEDGAFALSDGYETITAEQRFVSAGCVRAGEWMPVRSRLPV